MNLTDIVVWLIIVLGAVGVVLAIVTGKFSDNHAGIANLTAFHDFQPKDKQEAIEIIIEQDAGKNWVEQENGLDIEKRKQ